MSDKILSVACKVCGKASTSDARIRITSGICEACSPLLSDTPNSREMLETLGAPVLLMQGNPRQVITANKKALGLFGKELHQVEDKRGGQVFDCIHSFTEAGCGKDVNCENCKIKDAIVDTFNTGDSHIGVATTLQIRKADGIQPHVLQISTEKVGELALVRVERFDHES